jgi:hypothetical protein
MAGTGRFVGGLELGGDDAIGEQVFRTYRAAMGSRRVPTGGLLDTWEAIRAVTLGAALKTVERAVMQAFPIWADDLLEAHERALGLIPSGSDSRAERRERANTRLVWRPKGYLTGLSASLKAINAFFYVSSATVPDIDDISGKAFSRVTTIPGRRYSPPGFEVSQPRSHQNYADGYVVTVVYSDGGATGALPSTDDEAEARSVLHDSLPAWVDYVIRNDVSMAAGASSGALIGYSPLE